MKRKKFKKHLFWPWVLCLACLSTATFAADDVHEDGHGKEVYQGSEASNKTLTSLKENVNEATGGFSVSLSLLSVKGYIPLDVSIRYSAGMPGMLGLPCGWAYSIDFVSPGESVTYNDTTHVIDPDWQDNSGYRSGLKYLNQHGTVFTDIQYRALPVSYQYAGYEHYYRYLLGFPDGSHDYFDAMGKLVARDDRFGNHVVYAYANQNATVFNTVLVSIRDSLGQIFSLSNHGAELALSFTDSAGRSHVRKIFHDNKGVRIYVDALGNRTSLDYKLVNGVSVISRIIYPVGLETTVRYQSLIFTSEGGRTGGVPAVREVRHYDLMQKKVVSDVYYSGYCDLNYTGYPYYRLSRSRDNLLENIRRINYKYVVDRIQKMSDGSSLRTETVYNSQSQPVQISTYLPGDRQANPTWRTLLRYRLDPDRHAQTVNYARPFEVKNQVFNAGKNRYLTLVKTRMTYDLYGGVLVAEQYSYDPLSRKLVKISKTRNTYSDSWHLPLTQTTLLWQPLSRSWKSLKKQNSLTPDGKEIATEVTSMNGHAWKKRTYTYDGHGVKRSTSLSWMSKGHPGVDHVNTFVDYQIDSLHHVKILTYKDALGFSWHQIVDTATGDVLKIVSPGGQLVSYSYDLAGRKLSATDPEGKNRITFFYRIYQHDHENSVLEESTSGLKRKTGTDALGQVIRVWKNSNPSDPGELVLQEARTWDRAGRISVERDALGNHTSYTYDVLGMVTSIVDPYKNRTRIDYDYSGLSKTISVNGIRQAKIVSDPSRKKVRTTIWPNSHNPHQVSYNKVSLFYYDGGHHLVKKTDLAQDRGSGKLTGLTSTVLGYDPDYKTVIQRTSRGDTTMTERHDYDLLGNLLSASRQINGNRPVVRDYYRYNKGGRLVSEVWPNGDSINYQYDPNGWLIKKTLPDGRIISYGYDRDGRETRCHWHDSQGRQHELLSTYNAAGKPVLLRLDNRVEKFAYDQAENLVRHTYCSSGDCQDKEQLVYTYNKYGQKLSALDVNGMLTRYRYNGQGQIEGIKSSADGESVPRDSIIYSYTNPAHPGENGHYGEPDVTDHVGLYRVKTIRDAFGRVIETHRTNPSGAGMLSVAYHYNDLDLLTGVKLASDVYPDNPDLNYAVDYRYDALERLVSENRTTIKLSRDSIDYTYDDNSNLMKKIKNGVMTDYQYNGLDQLTAYSRGGQWFYLKYDRNGREISNGSGWQYQYDIFDHLVMAWSDKGHTIHYTYYPDGLRAGRTSSDSSKYRYYYDDEKTGPKISAIKSSTHGNTSYLLAKKERISGYTTGAGGYLQSLYYFNNNKSNVLILKKNRQGDLLFNGSTYYDQYGRHDRTPGSGVETNFTYNGEYEDPGTGLLYLKVRDYEPATARFMSMDSYQVFNKYNFADANPVMNIDPTGHLSVLNYILDSFGFIVAISALAFAEPEGMALISEPMLDIVIGTSVMSSMTEMTNQAMIDAHMISANSSVAKSLDFAAAAIALPGMVLTVAETGSFIASKLSNELFFLEGFAESEQLAQARVDLWNNYYNESGMPAFASAEVSRTNYTRLPVVPQDHFFSHADLFDQISNYQDMYNHFYRAKSNAMSVLGVLSIDLAADTGLFFSGLYSSMEENHDHGKYDRMEPEGNDWPGFGQKDVVSLNHKTHQAGYPDKQDLFFDNDNCTPVSFCFTYRHAWKM